MKKNKKFLNNKGFAITSIIYSMFILMLVLMTLTVLVLASRKNMLNKVKQNALNVLGIYDEVYEYGFTGDVQQFVVPVTGLYQIELWGAQGGSNEIATGGKGAYTKGSVYLNAGTTLYIYVGGKGKIDDNAELTAGYNGGGRGGKIDMPANLIEELQFSQYGAGGGGATDVRLVGGSWNDATSLNSRIMVAAGGSGASNWYEPQNGVAGGTLTGIDGVNYNMSEDAFIDAMGGTQNGGGVGALPNGSSNGGLGQGGSIIAVHGSGGGSGYYGGGSGGSGNNVVGTGASGSSFISGYEDCITITEYKFYNGNMISGNESMPNYTNNGNMTGNSNNGHAKITYASSEIPIEKPCTLTSGNGTNIGDIITCDTESFYVIENNGNDIRMLAKYNLIADLNNPIQSELSASAVSFAADYNFSSGYIYSQQNATGIYPYVDGYKNYLINLGISVKEAKLINQEEAQTLVTSYEWANNIDYWTGSSNGSNYMWYVYTDGVKTVYCTSPTKGHIRPVITIPVSDI